MPGCPKFAAASGIGVNANSVRSKTVARTICWQCRKHSTSGRIPETLDDFLTGTRAPILRKDTRAEFPLRDRAHDGPTRAFNCQSKRIDVPTNRTSGPNRVAGKFWAKAASRFLRFLGHRTERVVGAPFAEGTSPCLCSIIQFGFLYINWGIHSHSLYPAVNQACHQQQAKHPNDSPLLAQSSSFVTHIHDDSYHAIGGCWFVPSRWVSGALRACGARVVGNIGVFIQQRHRRIVRFRADIGSGADGFCGTGVLREHRASEGLSWRGCESFDGFGDGSGVAVRGEE